MRVCLFGVSFDNSNMGVTALAVSTVKSLFKAFPDATVFLLNHGEEDSSYRVKLNGGHVDLECLNTSLSKRIWRSNHYLWQVMLAVLYRLLAVKRLRDKIAKKSKYLQAILQSDACLDISGGDSFSDIYGLYRLLYVSSYKLLALLLKKKLILLPQTYGPFEKPIAKFVSRYILRRATAIYSRDRKGVECVRAFLNDHDTEGKIHFSPDVAFVLDPREPVRTDVGSLESLRTEDTIVAGVNVSGLLFNGGYTLKNMFGLNIDYRQLVASVINLLMREKRLLVLLVPHVFAPHGKIESDPDVCLQVYNTLSGKFKGRLFRVQGQYDQNEIKHIIGMCDFFIGSRMHACIAALSQGIPTIGLAYSKKFRGVFETVDVERLVVDMRHAKDEDILTTIAKAFEQRESIERHLKAIIPRVQNQVFKVFENLT